MGLATPKAQDRASIVFLIVSVPLFFPQFFLGKVPGPFAAGVTDSYVFFEPYARVFMQAIRHGDNPFWSHNSSFGAPTLLTLGTGALHPFHLFHLLMPDWLAFAIGWWARLALFGTYFYAYLRRTSARPWVALSFTLALTFGSFFINYSLEIIGYVMAFFPMALYYADKLGAEITVRDFACLALAIACLILGGFPSVILYLLLTVGAYLLFMARRWKPLIVAALACCTGVALVLPALVETLHFYPGTGYDPEQRSGLFFYTPSAMTALNLVIPSVFGNSLEYRNVGMRDFYGTLLGAGILTVPLAVLLAAYSSFMKIHMKKEVVFWLSVVSLCLVAYFNVFEIKQLLQYIPVLNEHPFTRLQTVIALGSVAAAALLVEQMLRLPLHTGQWRLLLGAVGLVIFVAYILATSTFTTVQVRLNSLIYGTIAVLSLWALAWAVLRPSRPAGLAFVASNIILGIATSWSYTYYFDPQDYYPENDLIGHIKHDLMPGARVLDVQDVLFKQTAIAYNIPSVTNHWFSQPSLRTWVHQLSSAASKTGLTIDTIHSINNKNAWPLLRQMHVQFVSLPYSGNQAWIDDYHSMDWRVISKNKDGISLLEVLDNGRTLKEQGGLSGDGYSGYIEGAGRISFQPTAPTSTIPVRFHDGWHIKKGAISIAASPDHLISVLPDNHAERVELEYFPRHFYFWLAIGPVALLIGCVSLTCTERRR